MKITFLNGNPDPNNEGFDGYLGRLAALLRQKEHQPEILNLREMILISCSGCWGCWVQTPGRCLMADESPELCAKAIQSDLLVFASPLIMGFTSALLKKAHEKLIPLLHPYIEIDRGECHHRGRYPRYPRLGLLLQPEAEGDDLDLVLVREIYRRDAINLKSDLVFVATTDRSVTEVSHEINRL